MNNKFMNLLIGNRYNLQYALIIIFFNYNNFILFFKKYNKNIF